MRILTNLPADIRLLKTGRFDDSRGTFIKLFDLTLPEFLQYKIKQSNIVINKEKYILRGLHYQTGDTAEAKIFKVISGRIQLSLYQLESNDQKKNSAYSLILDDPSESIYVPRGYATGYMTLDENTVVAYMSDNDYCPANEKGIRWNDPSLKIDWQCLKPLTSEKDNNWDLL